MPDSRSGSPWLPLLRIDAILSVIFSALCVGTIFFGDSDWWPPVRLSLWLAFCLSIIANSCLVLCTVTPRDSRFLDAFRINRWLTVYGVAPFIVYGYLMFKDPL
jgi:hypothetical protein